jgi:hypothetical protein
MSRSMSKRSILRSVALRTRAPVTTQEIREMAMSVVDEATNHWTDQQRAMNLFHVYAATLNKAIDMAAAVDYPHDEEELCEHCLAAQQAMQKQTAPLTHTKVLTMVRLEAVKLAMECVKFCEDGATGVMKPTDIADCAKQLHTYIQARAAVEGVGYELAPEFFQAGLELGVRSFLGVEVNEAGMLINDEHEPRAGYLQEWLESSI